ncbi:MAG TPA: metallophosphoesterase, partial [Sphingomicrobium sp.]|nr:metallophosphoesterase [Sphingomicrobium sp.]
MFDDDEGERRRGFLKCMAWAGTGALFALDGGLLSSVGIESAIASPVRRAAVQPFTFVQLSDSHIGFNKPPNADARATFAEAIAKVKALRAKPDFIIHTGDVSQLSRDDEFDDADQMLKALGLPVFFVPGEHDMLDPDGGKAFLNRFGKGTHGAGWYSFDHRGVHFVALVNVADLKPGGMGNLGTEQLKWLASDLSGRPS